MTIASKAIPPLAQRKHRFIQQIIWLEPPLRRHGKENAFRIGTAIETSASQRRLLFCLEFALVRFCLLETINIATLNDTDRRRAQRNAFSNLVVSLTVDTDTQPQTPVVAARKTKTLKMANILVVPRLRKHNRIW